MKGDETGDTSRTFWGVPFGSNRTAHAYVADRTIWNRAVCGEAKAGHVIEVKSPAQKCEACKDGLAAASTPKKKTKPLARRLWVLRDLATGETIDIHYATAGRWPTETFEKKNGSGKTMDEYAYTGMSLPGYDDPEEVAT